MRIAKFFWTWAGRIPARFTIPFALFMLAYLEVVARFVEAFKEPNVADLLWEAMVRLGVPAWLRNAPPVRIFWEGTATTTLLLGGIVISYNLSVLIYRRIRHRPSMKGAKPFTPAEGRGNRLSGYEKIGIILAGGGAKGAYQAGAMKAIYEFLEENNALAKLRMIAGTSIGSWNALFWLAGLVKPGGPGQPSAHELWWRSISLDRIMEFDYFLPFRANHFMVADPWVETAQQMFLQTPETRQSLEGLFAAGAGVPEPVHFYFTRSRVEQGRLEFCTNWPGIRELKASNNQPVVPSGRYEVIAGKPEAAIGGTLAGVFASMDIPPLFPYVKLTCDAEAWYEDGGVIDNLPMWFGTEVEHCDLLFVLPLNATFAEPVNQTSVAKRISRVLSVRQGALERHSFHLALQYNELCGVANAPVLVASQAASSYSSPARVTTATVAARHKGVSIFAICPQSPLAIDTIEFWKTRQAGEAFGHMYAATKYELQDKFEEITDPSRIRLVLVSPEGERSYAEDF